MAETEFIDVLDKNGQKTGQVLSREEVHDKELWHGVAHVWIYNSKGQILFQLRHPNLPWGSGKWDLAAGGHILSGQEPIEAAIMEASEEIGVEFKQNNLKLAGSFTAENPTESTGKIHRIYEWDYIIQVDLDLSTLKLQPEETIDVKWFTPEQIEKDLDSEAKSKYAPRSKELYMLIINKIREANA